MAEPTSPPVTDEATPTGVSPKKGIGTVTFGVAAADKEFNSRTLKVYPQELLPYAQGDLEATEVKTKVGMEDSRVQQFDGEAKLTNTITAEYFDMATNRMYPPDIRRNEQILLINLHDSDTWYWLPMGRNDNLRRNERFRLGVSDDKAFKKELGNDNTYYLEFDTLENKHFVISTSKSDSEEFRYLIKIDAAASTVQICDDDNNLILMESKEQHILIRNRDGSSFDVNKKIATMIGVDDCIIKGGRQIVLESPLLTLKNDREDKDGRSAIVMQSKNLAMQMEKSFVMDSPAIGFNGQVTVPYTLVAKQTRSECHTTGKVEKREPSSTDGTGDFSNIGGDSKAGTGDFSTLMARAMSLFSEEGGSSEVSAQDYAPEPVEDNRPKSLQTEFKDGKDAQTLGESANYSGSGETLKSYEGCSIDMQTGKATDPSNTPNTFDINNSGNRQCAAWDQLSQGMDRISEGFRNLRSAINSLGDEVENLGGSASIVSAARDAAKIADALGIEARVLGVNSRMANMGGE